MACGGGGGGGERRYNHYATIVTSYIYITKSYLALWHGVISPFPAKLFYLNFQPLELCLATATHYFKWVKFTHICLIWCLVMHFITNNSDLVD